MGIIYDFCVIFFFFVCIELYTVVTSPTVCRRRRRPRKKKKRTKTHGPPCTATHAPRGRYESKHEVTQPRAKTGVLYLPTYLAMYVLYEYTYTVLVVVFEPYATHSNIE